MKKNARYEKIWNMLIGYSYGLLVVITTILIFYSCSTVKKTPEQKAYEARLKQISDLQMLRQEFPCDTSTVYITQTDTAFITLAPDTITRDGIKYITKDRVITNTVIKQVTVIDSATLEEMRLNNLQAQYLLQNCQEGANKLADENKKKDAQITEIKGWKRGVIIGFCILSAISLVIGVIKLKSFLL